MVVAGVSGLLLIVLILAWLFWPADSGQSTGSNSGAMERIPIGSAVPDSTVSSPGGNGGVEPSAQSVEQTIRIQILNGCGVKGLAQRAATVMRANGFDVRETRNAAEMAQYTSVILRSGTAAMAQRVADSLGVASERISAEDTQGAPDIDVTVVLGADYGRLRMNLKANAKER